MKNTIAFKVSKAIVICLILIWTSNPSLGQSGGCDTTSVTFIGEGLPTGFDSGELTIESIQLPFPTLIEVTDSNEVYVFGGQPFLLDVFVDAILTGNPGQPNPIYYNRFTPYVVQVDPVTMDTMFLELSGGAGIPYLGGITKHPNGFLYAIAQARIFQIDPADMSILQFIDMPLQDQLMIYNGVFVASNGLLITKSAILDDFSQGQFFMLDPNTLQIVNQTDLEAGSARLTFDCDSLGNEYIYHLNQDYTFRMLVTNDSLIVDTTWQAAYDPYGTGVNTEPTSPRILGNRVAYTTNTSFSAIDAMKIFWQRTDQPYFRDTDTLGGYFMFSDTLAAGYDFWGLTVDDETGVIVGQDQANGKIAAYFIDENEQLQYLWERNYGISGQPFIVGNREMVYTNDYNPIEGVDYLVILDLFTGMELGRIQTPGTTPSISSTKVGAYNDFYYCSNEVGELLGYFHRVSIEGGPLSTENLVATKNIRIVPNPFQYQTLVTWDNQENEPFQAKLLNVTGQVIRRYSNLKGESLRVEKEGLFPGIYFLNMIDQAGNSGTVKLLLLE